MMASNNVLRWIDGRGWLVLSSGNDKTSAVRARALGQTAADGGLALVCLGAVDLCDQTLADLEDLGAPPGYLVDVLSEDDQTILSKLSEAAIIIVSSEAPAPEIRSGLLGAAAEGMRTAYQNGAVILAEGSASIVFGAWVAQEGGELLNGLDWLRDSVIVPGVTSLAGSETARSTLAAQPSSIALSIGAGSALALGPDGEVEPWGKREIALALGPDYKP